MPSIIQNFINLFVNGYVSCAKVERNNLTREQKIIVHRTQTANDSFYRTDLEKILRAHQIMDVVITGCATDFCVNATVHSALVKDSVNLIQWHHGLKIDGDLLFHKFGSHSGENTSFRKILDQARKQIAVRYLEKKIPICDIALLLGFSEQSAFNHAFRRWTGSTPGEFRGQYRENRPEPSWKPARIYL